ncbi:hypothetical protein BT67DRAFT_443273 [Trichocladium antarcticum]|uniref:Uncharacterized protein n=1 Tax=Trichocladium antarcticum TaxID=1450529 RepID=A0AAN6UH38_9PEZI|nr:hypothetical protein BT67DRAFT_443273 [Trichocladium antarcticum]
MYHTGGPQGMLVFFLSFCSHEGHGLSHSPSPLDPVPPSPDSHGYRKAPNNLLQPPCAAPCFGPGWLCFVEDSALRQNTLPQSLFFHNTTPTQQHALPGTPQTGSRR